MIEYIVSPYEMYWTIYLWLWFLMFWTTPFWYLLSLLFEKMKVRGYISEILHYELVWIKKCILCIYFNDTSHLTRYSNEKLKQFNAFWEPSPFVILKMRGERNLLLFTMVEICLKLDIWNLELATTFRTFLAITQSIVTAERMLEIQVLVQNVMAIDNLVLQEELPFC